MTAEVEIIKELFLSTHPAMQLILRFLAAIFGGYGITYSLMKAISLLLPWQKHTETVSFCEWLLPLVYLAAIVWTFAAASAQYAWKVLLSGIVLVGGIALIASCFR
ncbi:MAG: hypothetical protein K0Q53_425 [Massilibacillus sp.]|jgi:hypothetical protein|nr:hypothetical protein [Massilibacillus sp.]